MTHSDAIEVLVVDDEPAVVEMLTLLLSLDQRFQVVTSAGSGEDAIEAFTHSSPDVVLLDFRLPGMNGMETARAMKRLRPEAKILMLTGHDAADIHAMNRDGDVEVVISKGSFSLQRLQEAAGLAVTPSLDAKL